MADEKNKGPALPTVAAPVNATIGDENLPEPRDAVVEVNDEPDHVNRTQPEVAKPEVVPVYEVSVTVDEVVEAGSPLGVQVPDAGRTPGGGLLPIHGLVGARRVEEIFAEAGEETTVSDEARAQSNASGSTAKGARGSDS